MLADVGGQIRSVVCGRLRSRTQRRRSATDVSLPLLSITPKVRRCGFDQNCPPSDDQTSIMHAVSHGSGGGQPRDSAQGPQKPQITDNRDVTSNPRHGQFRFRLLLQRALWVIAQRVMVQHWTEHEGRVAHFMVKSHRARISTSRHNDSCDDPGRHSEVEEGRLEDNFKTFISPIRFLGCKIRDAAYHVKPARTTTFRHPFQRSAEAAAHP